MNTNFIEIRRELHKIPELGFQEFKTQKFLLKFLNKLPQNRLEIKTWKTGILVKIKGLNPEKIIGYRTDIDGLPIKERTNLPFSSEHDGLMHACGHDIHMTIALSIVEHFVYHQIDNDIVVIFQPAEEGPGGALPLMQSIEFKEWKPDVMFGLHVSPELSLGTISTNEHILFAHCSELYIKFFGKNSHGAMPHLGNDVIVAASHFVTQIQSLIARNINPIDSGVITIGKFSSGSAANIISDEALLEGTIRSLNDDTMTILKKRITELSKGIESGFDCKIDVTFENDYYGVYNNPIHTNNFISFVKDQEYLNFIEAKAAMTAEDFGYFLKEIPGFMFWLGVESYSGLHTSTLNPNEKSIEIGSKLMIDYIKSLNTDTLLK